MTGGIVVCLGETGRNFAAGMSGGFAYVLDEKSNFSDRCNKEMVELNQLKADVGTPDVSDFLQADETRLKQIIEKHVEHTGSARGQMILDDWASYLPQFIKVMPVDYRNALEKQSNNKAAA